MIAQINSLYHAVQEKKNKQKTLTSIVKLSVNTKHLSHQKTPHQFCEVHCTQEYLNE